MAKILVVEDDHTVRANIVEILESADHKVFSVADGQSAIGLAEEIYPNLIISDIMMPVMNGYELLEAIMENKSLSKIPFIFLSAKVEHQDIRNGMELGADDYIVKPFSARDLINAVNTRLKKFEKLKSESDNSLINTNKNGDDKIKVIVNDGGIPKFIKINDIVVITAEAEYTNVFFINNEKIFVRKLLKNWEENLPSNLFVRIHRSTLININYIEKIEKLSQRAYIVYMENTKKPYTISERYAVKLKKELGF